MQAILSTETPIARDLPPIAIHQVLHPNVITAPKPIPVVVPKLPRNAGVTELITIVYVRLPAILRILSRSVHAILKALPLVLPVRLRWSIPSALSAARSIPALPLSIPTRRRWRWSLPILRLHPARTQCK